MQDMPDSECRVARLGPNEIAVAMHSNHGYLHWTKALLLRDALDDLPGGDDLVGVGVDVVQGRAVI